jgi:hypothetical protein
MPASQHNQNHSIIYHKDNQSHGVMSKDPSSDIVDSIVPDNLDEHSHDAIESEIKLVKHKETALQSIMKKDEKSSESEYPVTGCSKSSSKEEEINFNTESKSVHFSALQIRTFPMILGDHPCCKTGLPVSLDWDHTKEEIVPIEEYESSRQARSCRSSLRMDQSTRREILGQVSDHNDLKRAERKMFRERERGGKRRMTTTSDFFATPLIDSLQE